MSVSAYETQVQTIADGLSGADPERSSAYQNGAEAYLEKLDGLKKRQEKLKQEISGQSVILFHEAYAYVAEDYGLQVNYLLDLDEERQVSAGEVSDVLSAVRKGHVKYILQKNCMERVWEIRSGKSPMQRYYIWTAESRNLRKRQLY